MVAEALAHSKSQIAAAFCLSRPQTSTNTTPLPGTGPAGERFENVGLESSRPEFHFPFSPLLAVIPGASSSASPSFLFLIF